MATQDFGGFGFGKRKGGGRFGRAKLLKQRSYEHELRLEERRGHPRGFKGPQDKGLPGWSGAPRISPSDATIPGFSGAHIVRAHVRKGKTVKSYRRK